MEKCGITREAVEKWKLWFDAYTASFIGRDKDLDFAVALKRKHTSMVVGIITELSEALGLPGEKVLVAQACALFHDVGRFPQFARYRTFKDTCTENHALLGIKVLEKEGVLNSLAPETAGLIRSGVEHHNCLELPEHLSPEELLVIRLLRDADKIDIYRVTSSHYADANGAGGAIIDLGLPINDKVSSSIAEAVAGREPVSYELCASVNDFKLLQLGWVYDMNFPESFQLLQKKGYIRVLLEALPDDSVVEKVKTRVMEWIEKKVQGPPTGCYRPIS